MTTPTPAAPKQARARKTREKLVAAAQTAFSRDGYATTTARSITDLAGVSYGTFYNYFEDKDVLLRELAQTRFAGIRQTALALVEADQDDVAHDAEAIRGRLQAVVELVTVYHREDPGLHAVLTERRHADPELEAMTDAAERALVERIALLLKTWGHDGDVEATAFVLFGLVEGSIHAHVLGAATVDDSRLTRALVDALYRIARPRVGAPTE